VQIYSNGQILPDKLTTVRSSWYSKCIYCTIF